MPAVRKYASAADRQSAYRERCSRRMAETSSGPSVPPAPGKRRWDGMIGQAVCLLEQAAGEMQDYYDQRSETWQESQAGESLIERVESLTEIVAALQGA